MASGSRDGSNGSILHRVWRKLPLELVEVILSRLPFESLMRFRAVCKRFNSLITSRKFARECQRQQAWKPVAVNVRTFTPRDSCSVDVFNNETNSWVRRPLPVLEARLYPLELSCASGGLLCFDTRAIGTFVVCNPLTGAFRILEFPNLPDDELFMTYLCPRAVTGLQNGSVKLLLMTVKMFEARGKLFCYDSADGSWKADAPLHVANCELVHWCLSVKSDVLQPPVRRRLLEPSFTIDM